MKSFNEYINEYKQQLEKGDIKEAYKRLDLLFGYLDTINRSRQNTGNYSRIKKVIGTTTTSHQL